MFVLQHLKVGETVETNPNLHHFQTLWHIKKPLLDEWDRGYDLHLTPYWKYHVLF